MRVYLSDKGRELNKQAIEALVELYPEFTLEFDSNWGCAAARDDFKVYYAASDAHPYWISRNGWIIAASVDCPLEVVKFFEGKDVLSRFY